MQIQRRVPVPVLFCLSLSIAMPVSAQETDRVSGFSQDEVQALSRGELVRRNLPRGAGHEFGGVSFLRLDAPIEEVWDKAKDPSALTVLIPTLSRATVEEDDGETRVVHMHHAFGVGESDYWLRMVIDDARRELSFAIDTSRPHDVRSGRGFLRLSSYRGGTIVTWGMRLDPGAGLVGDMFGPMLTGWLLKPPLCLRDALEPGREPSC